MSVPWDYIAKLVCIGDSGCGKSSLTIRLCEGRFSPHHDVTIGVEFGSRIVPVGPPHSSTTPPTPTPTPTTSASAAAAAVIGLPEPPRDNSKSKNNTNNSSQPQKHMKLSLWDTAGQETYKSVTRSYFRGASGALLVFDLSRRQTFDHVTHWLNDLRQIAEPDIVVVLVGNKADLTTGDDQDEDDNDDDDDDNNKTQFKTQFKTRQVSRKEAESWAKRNDILEYVETSAKSGQNVENAFMRVADRIYHNIQAGKYNLNDRRSGVKGPAAASASASASASRQHVRLAAAGANNSMSGACC